MDSWTQVLVRIFNTVQGTEILVELRSTPNNTVNKGHQVVRGSTKYSSG